MLPQFLQDMWDGANKHPLGKRKRETQIVNEAFGKKGGQWELNLQKPFFEEEKKKVTNNYSRDGQQGKPRAVWAEEFRGGVGANHGSLFCVSRIVLLLS